MIEGKVRVMKGPMYYHPGVQQAVIPGRKEVYIQTGSTISLSCEVGARAHIVGNVHWLHGTKTLNYSSARGGISMEVRASFQLFRWRERKIILILDKFYTARKNVHTLYFLII